MIQHDGKIQQQTQPMRSALKLYFRGYSYTWSQQYTFLLNMNEIAVSDTYNCTAGSNPAIATYHTDDRGITLLIMFLLQNDM